MADNASALESAIPAAEAKKIEKIEHEIDATKASLTEKLTTLENQVVGTISETTNAVAETVNSVKDTVQESVAAVKESVQGTVESVKEGVSHAFDVPSHVRNHPWGAVGVSVAAGFTLGLYLTRRNRKSFADLASAGAPQHAYDAPYAGHVEPAGGPALGFSAPPSRPSGPSMFDRIGGMLGPQLAGLKQVALTAAIGMAYDAVRKAVPPEWEGKVRETFNEVQSSLVSK